MISLSSNINAFQLFCIPFTFHKAMNNQASLLFQQMITGNQFSFESHKTLTALPFIDCIIIPYMHARVHDACLWQSITPAGGN
jgi:hypothetical protein